MASWCKPCRRRRWRNGERWAGSPTRRLQARRCRRRLSPRSSACSTSIARPRKASDMTAQDSPSPLAIAARHTEDALAAAALLLMAFLPAIEPVLRKLFDVGIPGTSGYVENLTLWVAYLGVMVATREKRHLSLSTGMVKLLS